MKPVYRVWALIIVGGTFVGLPGCSSFGNIEVDVTPEQEVTKESYSAPEIFPSATASKVPTISYTTSPTPNTVAGLPGVLNCHTIPPGPEGFTWNGLTIGRSTENETVDKFKAAVAILNDERNSIVYYFSSEPGSTLIVETCVEDSRLKALLIDADYWSEFPKTFEGWVSRFGCPDRISWGDTFETRSLIWAERGLLAVISAEYGNTWAVALLPPIARSELRNSWLVKELPATNGRILDEQPTDKERLENPWLSQCPSA